MTIVHHNAQRFLAKLGSNTTKASTTTTNVDRENWALSFFAFANETFVEREAKLSNSLSTHLVFSFFSSPLLPSEQKWCEEERRNFFLPIRLARVLMCVYVRRAPVTCDCMCIIMDLFRSRSMLRNIQFLSFIFRFLCIPLGGNAIAKKANIFLRH